MSMPSTGFYLFLPPIKKQIDTLTNSCQCPQRASTYFFATIKQPEQKINKSVNALNGLLLISSEINKGASIDGNVCQCPQRASTYFFGKSYKFENTHLVCQCPQRASTYFFHLQLKLSKLVNIVSMPSTGFYLFLPGIIKRSRQNCHK